MPRIVRNFWADLDVDGRDSRIGTGPRSACGGLDLRLKQRDEGCVADILEISSRARDNKLITSVRLCPDIVTSMGLSEALLRDGTLVELITFRDEVDPKHYKDALKGVTKLQQLFRRTHDNENYDLMKAKSLAAALLRCFGKLNLEEQQAILNALAARTL